jgi:hypothetical protein
MCKEKLTEILCITVFHKSDYSNCHCNQFHTEFYPYEDKITEYCQCKFWCSRLTTDLYQSCTALCQWRMWEVKVIEYHIFRSDTSAPDIKSCCQSIIQGHYSWATKAKEIFCTCQWKNKKKRKINLIICLWKKYCSAISLNSTYPLNHVC